MSQKQKRTSADGDGRTGPKDAEPHPCLQIAIEQRTEEASDQKLLWLFREQLEVQKASFEAMLLEHRQLSTHETAEQFERFEEQLCLQRAGLEAAAQRLEVQEQHLEQLLTRFVQLRSREAMPGLQGGHAGQEFFDVLVGKIRAESESSLQAHLHSIEELLQTYSIRGRGGMLPRSASSVLRQASPKPSKSNSTLQDMPENQVPSHDMTMGVGHPVEEKAWSSERRYSSEKKWPPGDVSQPVDVPREELRERSARDVLAAQAVMGLSYFRKPSSLRRAAESLGRVELVLEVISGILIVANCVWMGVEADIAMRSLWAGEPEPKWLSTVDFLFALAFLLELIGRLAVQGWGFFTLPGFKWNCFDLVLLLMQVVDAVTSFYNASFIRTLRVLRFFRGARIVKTINAIRHLRVLIACLYGSLSSLFWVMVLLFIVIYLCATAVMQTLPVTVHATSLEGTADLQDHWGSLWACMTTLFSAVSGGAPWANLIDPLSKLSRMYDIAFVFFVIFVVFGVLNIVAALFVESLTNLAEVDANTEMRANVHSKDSAVNALRKSFLESASIGGLLTLDEMSAALDDTEVQAQLQALHMEKDEAVGLFHLLDFDAMGQVSIDEFVFALVKLKSKMSKAVDMATVMYENKRILLRMATFMKFVEENFKAVREALGADY